MGLELREGQKFALRKLRDGKVLYGGVGSGKSVVALMYWRLRHRNSPLLIITTATKRDRNEWQLDMIKLLLDPQKLDVTIDSWNNIRKYQDLTGYFVIFDEQRLVGYGAWVKAFLRMVKSNKWILLSGTPGDTWHDYLPLFIANGFFKNKSEFEQQHVKFARCTSYPKVERYIYEERLERMRSVLLVPMDVARHTERHERFVNVEYDVERYKEASEARFDPFKGEPIQNAGGLCYVQRRLAGDDPDKYEKIYRIAEHCGKLIIFYNYSYELESLLARFLDGSFEVGQKNGRRHDPVPASDRWVYLVQYGAGAEAWNCIETDSILFASRSYSYKVMEQAKGRIDRLNTPFTHLFYYYIETDSSIDRAVKKAISEKKTFNERAYFEGFSSGS